MQGEELRKMLSAAAFVTAILSPEQPSRNDFGKSDDERVGYSGITERSNKTPMV
jgi:hypothetical protein